MVAMPEIRIGRSVGYRGQNNIADVRTVQERLNLLLDETRVPLVEDGFYGSFTKAMIGDFQSNVVGFFNPDERVDPNGKTLSALNDPASREKWKANPVSPVPPKPVDPKTDPPEPPVDPSSMPKIPIYGALDGTRGFDTYPPPSQVLGPLQVKMQPQRDGAWIMVPEGGERTIVLGIDAGAPVKIRSKMIDDQGRVSVPGRKTVFKASIEDQSLVIKGLKPCKDCKLDLFQDGKHARVYVSVKPRRIVPVFAFYVEHGPGLKCRVSPDELRMVFQIANREILEPQCNVELRLMGDTFLSHKEIGRHLGFVVREDTVNTKKDEWKYLSPFMRKQQFPQSSSALQVKTVNLFIVRQLASFQEGDERPVKARGAMRSNTGMCVIEDQSFGKKTRVAGIAHTLCHEVGHLLIEDLYKQTEGVGEHNPYRDALMYRAGSGNKLYRVEIEAMNPTKSYPTTVNPFAT